MPARSVPNHLPCAKFPGVAALLSCCVTLAGEATPGWVSASSVHSPQYTAESAFDGDRQTRWASAQAGDRPAWLEVDFGREVSVGEMVIHWERAAAQAYEIRVSSDRKAWQTIHRQAEGVGGTERLTGMDGRGRYLRIQCQRPGSWGLFSIWEVEFPRGEAAAALVEHRRRAAQLWADQQREAREALTAAWTEHGIEEIV
ncbi:MAG: discoidin domain-containing protein, partial [Planctomycetes bacterium]|nr:discoidin domain-containing protein [Planctomycetota bacterium]